MMLAAASMFLWNAPPSPGEIAPKEARVVISLKLLSPFLSNTFKVRGDKLLIFL